MNLNEEITTKNDSYRYYGESVKSGYCGIEIDNIGDYHNGKFTCVIVIRTREDPIEASIDIIIASEFNHYY
ncbi:hypothetical protein C0J52_25358 [Blattella germanica]|nr:hypothetical protein C0J52_25358 [Blattella germanica]